MPWRRWFRGQGRGEAGEDVGAERGDDFVGRAVRGEDDVLDAGLDEAHLVELGQVFLDGGAWTGDGDGEGLYTHALQSNDGSGRIFDGDTSSGEDVSNGVSDRVVASDDEDSTHGQDSWGLTSMLLVRVEEALGR